MQEDVISRTEDHIDRVNVGQNKHDDYFSAHPEEHVHVLQPLRKDRLPSCLCYDVIEELTDYVGVKIGRLSIFDGLCGVANGTVGVGRDLLDPAVSELVDLREGEGG